MAFLAGQTLTAAALNTATQKIIARGHRTTTSTGTTTEIGVIRLDDKAILGGHTYKIWTTALALDTDTNNDVIAAQVRYTTDGSTPTTSSAIMSGSRVQLKATDAAAGESKTIQTTYTPASNETLSLLLTVLRVSGAGSEFVFNDGNFATDLVLEYGGQDVGDTGTNI